MQNRQSLSHKSTNYKLFLHEIFHNSRQSFTDTTMLERLPIKSLNTIRKIRIDLQNQGIIRLTESGLPNNEKRYKLANKLACLKLLRKYTILHEQKIAYSIITDNNATYFTKFNPLITIKYNSKTWLKPDHKYPLKLYKKGICPVCQGRLHDFKSGKFNLDDKKCSKCKFTFYFGATIVASEKPIKNKKSLNFDPWHSYDNAAWQNTFNKIQGKIMRHTYNSSLLDSQIGRK